MMESISVTSSHHPCTTSPYLNHYASAFSLMDVACIFLRTIFFLPICLLLWLVHSFAFRHSFVHTSVGSLHSSCNH
jgi:hypothetical protein